MSSFKEIAPMEIGGNMIKLIGADWMLITATDGERTNTMTASWGGMGFLWGKPVTFMFIRPQRYTFGIVEKTDTYSLCFFDEAFRKQLNYCGAASGRDEDKIQACGFTVLEEEGVPYFAEAKLALICRKLYVSRLGEEKFVDTAIPPKAYAAKDYHHVYIGEITKALKK